MIARRSALAHPELRARLAAERPGPVYLAGFSLAHEGLATMFDAIDLGLPLRLIEDAVASPAIGDRDADEIDRTGLAIAASLSSLATGAEVLHAPHGRIVGFQGGARG
jgi:nicotinamidase-related amidase